MNVYTYEVHYRNNDDDPWQFIGPDTTDREAAMARAELIHRKANGYTAVRVVRRDKENPEDVYSVAEWKRTKTYKEG